MKNVQKFDDFIGEGFLNESTKADRLISDIFKEAKKSKNFSKVEMSKADDNDGMDFVGNVVYIKSKLKGQNDFHKNDLDEFTIGVDKYNNEVVAIYDPSGYDQKIKSIDDFIQFTRAKKIDESEINEGMVQIAGKSKPSGAKVLATIIVDDLIKKDYLKPGADKVKTYLVDDIKDVIMNNTF